MAKEYDFSLYFTLKPSKGWWIMISWRHKKKADSPHTFPHSIYICTYSMLLHMYFIQYIFIFGCKDSLQLGSASLLLINLLTNPLNNKLRHSFSSYGEKNHCLHLNSWVKNLKLASPYTCILQGQLWNRH